jgi:single-stranded-DNA-specific exonuclease
LAQLHTQPRLGIQYLLQPTGLPAQQLDTDAIGFHIGPRLNSAGRLDSAEISVQLLTTEDSTVAQTIAQRIETLNQERKILQRKVEDEALSLLHKNPQWSNEPIVVLSGSNWHPSVVGVVASSLTQQLQKPVALIAISSESTTALARGSARSFADFDIHTAIAAQHDLIETSGGHPMAAGFSIKTEHITLFRQRINQYARKQTADSAKTAAVSTPFNIAWHEVSLNLCLELERLAPFGAGNPRPMLNSQNITVARIEPVGSDGRHQALWLKNDVGHIAKVMWWRSANQPAPSADADYDVVFTLQPNWYRGKVMMQITLHQLILRNTSLADQSANQHIITSRFRIIDLRREQDPAAIWRNLAETYGEEHIVHYGKQMHPFAQTITTPAPTSLAAQMLVFWVAPPSLHTLYALLRQYSPQFVALMPHTLPLETDTPDGFMRSLKGMIKVADKRGDALDDSDVIERMAARICHKPETIIEGITCATAPTATVSANLALMLEETRAYRHFVAVAPAESVFRIED